MTPPPPAVNGPPRTAPHPPTAFRGVVRSAAPR